MSVCVEMLKTYWCFCVNVESTRKVYESKLEKVMTQAPVKASTDKTFYREGTRLCRSSFTLSKDWTCCQLLCQLFFQFSLQVTS